MSKKSRYLLLFLGFIFFVFFAPIIVLYVRGESYDFTSHSFTKTGILAIRTEPQSGNIFVDGKLVGQSSADIKFLKPNDYNITISKNDYFDWTKRLNIKSGEVTWANMPGSKIFLFFKNPRTQTIATNVSDVFTQNSNLAYLAGSSLVFSSLNSPEQSENYTIPEPVNSFVVSPDQNTFLLSGINSFSATSTNLIFNKRSKNFINVSALFSPKAIFKFSSDNQLFALDNNTLFRVNIDAKQKETLISGVKQFNVSGGNIYFIKEKNGLTDLRIANLANLNEQVLVSKIPTFSSSEIIINSQKQIVILADGSLYNVGTNLEKVADGISFWNFEPITSNLILSRGGELSFYDFSSQTLNFITRSELKLISPQLRANIGFSFFLKGNLLQALELDARDHQNEYTLYTATNPQKMFANEQANSIVLLDNGELKVLKIR